MLPFWLCLYIGDTVVAASNHIAWVFCWTVIIFCLYHITFHQDAFLYISAPSHHQIDPYIPKSNMKPHQTSKYHIMHHSITTSTHKFNVNTMKSKIQNISNLLLIFLLFSVNTTCSAQPSPSPPPSTATATIFCSGNEATQFCLCYNNRIECKTAIDEYNRTDCFWHNTHQCISITYSPTNNPTLEPTLYPSNNPTLNPSQSPTTPPFLSTLQCGDTTSGATQTAYDINWYLLQINTFSDIFIDSCGSMYDTWLYFQYNDGIPIIDCDDCGECNLEAQLNVSRIYNGTYRLGIGGYLGNFGTYKVQIICSDVTTIAPTIDPTLYPTKYPTINPTFNPSIHPTLNPSYDPTSDPTNDPTLNPTYIPTKIPTFIPTNIPTPNPTPKPTTSPTKTPTLKPTVFPTETPSTSPTNIPSTSPTSVDLEVLGDTEMAGNELNDDSKTTINAFEIAIIVGVLLVSLVIGCVFFLKFATKRKNHHILNLNNMSMGTDDECDGADDDDDDTEIVNIMYGHIRSNSNYMRNNIDIDEILRRATTELTDITTTDLEELESTSFHEQ